jgi:hypothetical protein
MLQLPQLLSWLRVRRRLPVVSELTLLCKRVANKQVVVILALVEMVWRGLLLAGFGSGGPKSTCRAASVPEAKTNAAKVDADCFLMLIQFLACHQTEKIREGVFKICGRAAQKWGWHFAKKAQALKKQKVVLRCHHRASCILTSFC